MPETLTPFDPSSALQRLDSTSASEHLTSESIKNIRVWLTEPRYAEYASQVSEHLRDEKWQVLDDVFRTIIPFGTGGRRGRMYPIGTNAINDRTIGESARGLAEYVIAWKNRTASEAPQGADGSTERLACAIAYDTRHNSPEFAHLCAEIMVAAGFKVYLLDPYRSTPELSFLVRHRQCDCGIMVTASHNPPSDNAVKCYWSTGGQLIPPHDSGVIDQVMMVDTIDRAAFGEAVAEGRIEICNQETDAAFLEALKTQRSIGGPRDLKIIYSPLHGVGSTAVLPILEADRFQDVEVFAQHAQPSGDFPNVPGHVSNPENPRVFDAIIERAQEIGADLIMATDPDCDRLGCAAPISLDSRGGWETFNGNQIGAILADYVLEQRKARGQLSGVDYVVKTLVTTEMIRRIADSYGVKTYGDLLVGFKWIGGVIDDFGPEQFLFGAEESHGYLVGHYARDKDAAVASMLMAECAAKAKAEGLSLHKKLDALYWQHGYHAERLVNQPMAGSQGMARTRALMEQLRTAPPMVIADMRVTSIDDFQAQTRRDASGATQPLEGPQGNMVVLRLESEGCFVAVRPSGTEPKVKFYMFTYVAAEQLANLDTTKTQTDRRLDQMQADLAAFAEKV